MATRETWVQVGAVVVALGLWAVAASQLVGSVLADPLAVALGLATYFVVLAGSHLYLAMRGDGGSLGVAARWRFVGVTALVLALLGGALLAPESALPLDAVLVAVAGVVAAGWFVLEARAGYDASVDEGDGEERREAPAGR
jgi:hypothetical protein